MPSANKVSTFFSLTLVTALSLIYYFWQGTIAFVFVFVRWMTRKGKESGESRGIRVERGVGMGVLRLMGWAGVSLGGSSLLFGLLEWVVDWKHSPDATYFDKLTTAPLPPPITIRSCAKITKNWTKSRRKSTHIVGKELIVEKEKRWEAERKKKKKNSEKSNIKNLVDGVSTVNGGRGTTWEYSL